MAGCFKNVCGGSSAKEDFLILIGNPKLFKRGILLPDGQPADHHHTTTTFYKKINKLIILLDFWDGILINGILRRG
jgi:hypothetical protein